MTQSLHNPMSKQVAEVGEHSSLTFLFTCAGSIALR